MFVTVRSWLPGWLAGLALTPVAGFGQVIIEHPRNPAVCVGESAMFITETIGDVAFWRLNGVAEQNLSPEIINQIGLVESNTPNGTIIKTLTIDYNETFNGLEVLSAAEASGSSGSTVNSSVAYLFYETNQQYQVTNLTSRINGKVALFNWDELKSNFTTQYLFGVYDANDNLIANQTTNTTHISYDLPPGANDTCQYLRFRVTADQCPDPDNDFIQNKATSFIFRKPHLGVGPLLAMFDNKIMVGSWPFDGDNAFQIVVTDLESGEQSTYNSTLPFTYTLLAACDHLNMAVSPLQCKDVPGFTDNTRIKIGFGPCPTTATETTETEITSLLSGTQAIYPSLLLPVAAIIPLLKWQH